MCQQGKLTHAGELMGKWSRRGFMRDAAGVAGGSVLLGTQLFVPGRPTTTVGQENQRSEAEARRPDRPEGYILDPQEGAAVGNHRIKADPKTGSMRLGVGLQQLASGKGIPIHRHEHEDEILFIHAGAGVGVVGRTVKRVNAGATIYIPAGVWHGVATEGSDVSVLWVVSPPNFAQYLEDVRQLRSAKGKVKQEQIDQIAQKHSYQDARYFMAERVANTLWDGDVAWGELSFDTSGLVIAYRGSRSTGHIDIVDAQGLNFIGEHTQPDGSKTKIILHYDFASDNRIDVNWGANLQSESTWVRKGIADYRK